LLAGIQHTKWQWHWRGLCDRGENKSANCICFQFPYPALL